MAVEDVRHRGWLGAERIPEVDGEDERVPPRVVVEHHFRRRVGENAAVPVEFAIDANGRKRWRQGARGHDMPDAERPIPAVEIAHLAGPYVRGADRQARLSSIDQIEVDDLGERALQWRGRVVAGAWSSRRSKPPSRNSTSTALRWSRSRRRPRRTGASRCARTSFPILSDVKGKIGAAFGLRFNLSDSLVELYKQLKNDLPTFNNDTSWTLPMPARYVIGQDGVILYSEVNPDYTRRPEPEDMIQ